MKFKLTLFVATLLMSSSRSGKGSRAPSFRQTGWPKIQPMSSCSIYAKTTPSYSDKGHIPGANLVAYKKLNGTMKVGGVTLKQMVPSATRLFSTDE